jgi:glyoxylase-like metal-dependent hydrolase (beta-lactamase superfamily II)
VKAWAEVADGVWHRRYDPLDVSVCVVRGTGALLVVDTRASHRQADALRDDLRALGGAPVRWVVNTHAHFDHSFGNARFPEATIVGHRRLPAHLDAYERPLLATWIAEDRRPVDEWREIDVTPPAVLVDDGMTLDVGGRRVDLHHLGRGHTDHDLVAHVPDAGAWLVGDLVEESGPPMYGSGSCPLDWPATVSALLDALATTAGPVVVPGHGAPVGPTFVADQQAQLQAAADVVRALHDAGIPLDAAAIEGARAWPFPGDQLRHALADGYAQLGG